MKNNPQCVMFMYCEPTVTDQMLIDAMENLYHRMVKNSTQLSYEESKILYENLWKLYQK